MVEGLQQVYDIDEGSRAATQKMFGISLLLVVTWMNFFELSRFAARFQILATIAKLLSCALIIITGLYFYLFKGKSLKNY